MRISWVPSATFLLVAVMAILASACTYDNEEDLYGKDLINCDTVSVRYSVEVKAIFDANCARCHVPGSAQFSGIPMGTHAQISNFTQNGRLVGRINNASSPMPPSGLMSACDRARIEAWVRAGAPDN